MVLPDKMNSPQLCLQFPEEADAPFFLSKNFSQEKRNRQGKNDGDKSTTDSGPPNLNKQWMPLLPFPLRVVWSSRLRKSWRLESKRGEVSTLTLPAFWQSLPLEFLQKVEAWCRLFTPGIPVSRRKQQLKELEKGIWAFLAEQCPAAKQGKDWPRLTKNLQTKGNTHDLEQILHDVNSSYFGGKLSLCICWSSRRGGLSFHSKRINGDGVVVDYISISRAYDHPSCPQWAVQGVVYHECLHIVCPPSQGRGRRIVHGREFRKREREFAHYREWAQWHREKMPLLVRAMFRKRRL